MKYRHEQRAEPLIEQLCQKEAGIMRAEQAVTKISRDYIRYAKKMAGIKNEMDRADRLFHAREEAERVGMEKERQYFLDLLDQGLSMEEIKQRLTQDSE